MNNIEEYFSPVSNLIIQTVINHVENNCKPIQLNAISKHTLSAVFIFVQLDTKINWNETEKTELYFLFLNIDTKMVINKIV